MRTTTAIAGALLTAAALLAPTAPAGAADSMRLPEVAWVGDNVVVSHSNPSTATVQAKFRCFGGEQEKTHLWVSVKQGGKNLEGEGSSARARAWYDTNYHVQTINCDGAWHTEKFVVQRYADKGHLHAASAYVQFCVFDKVGGFGYKYGWKNVLVAPYVG